jgi:hypothetical protein
MANATRHLAQVASHLSGWIDELCTPSGEAIVVTGATGGR